MNLSTKGRYGLRAMCELASASGDEPMSLSRIAEKQNLSLRYLEQLFHQLKKQGLVRSTRGVKGGYFLARPPAEITAGEIIRALDGDFAPVACADDCVACGDPNTCVTRPLWAELHDTVHELMNNKTLEELIKKENI